MPNYYIKHRPPGSPLWHVDGPYYSRQAALMRHSELKRKGHEVRLECHRPGSATDWGWVLGAAVVAAIIWMLLRGGC